MSGSRHWLSGLLVLWLVSAPRLAHACAVCSAGRDDETRDAFLLTTLFLSVLPLLLIGVGVLYLVRRARAKAQLEERVVPTGAARASSLPVGPA